MRLLPLLLLPVALASAALAAERTEFIPLRYASPEAIEAMLEGPEGSVHARPLRFQETDKRLFPGRQGLGEFGLQEQPGGLGGMRWSLPPGITGFAVDPIRRGLVVTGDDSGITSMQNVVRLLDVAPRQYRMKAVLVRLGEETLEGIETIPIQIGPASQSEFNPAIRVLEPQKAKLVLKRAHETLSNTTLLTANNRSGRFFWKPANLSMPSRAEVVPRGNGDGSITLAIRITSEAVPGSGGMFVRRIGPGQTLLLTFGDDRAVLVSAEVKEP